MDIRWRRMMKKIIKRFWKYHEKATENSNSILNMICFLAILFSIVINIFFKNTFFYNWFNIMIWVGILTHPYVQLKIKKIIKEVKLTNKMLKSEETDWMELK